MWSEDEIQFLFDNPKMSIKDIAVALGKTEGAVRAKRSRLGIRTEEVIPWTADERRIVQLHYGETDKEELMNLLPGRSWNAIRSQAFWLRKRQWNV